MNHITKAAENSSESNECIHVDENAFKDYKYVMEEMYKKVKSIQ